MRELFERGDAVGVLPYDPVTDSAGADRAVPPGRHPRQHSPWMLELIAGVVEPGESDEEVAHREAMEEAGCELSELVTYRHGAAQCRRLHRAGPPVLRQGDQGGDRRYSRPGGGG